MRRQRAWRPRHLRTRRATCGTSSGPRRSRGTQFDAFPHQMIANRMYNCFKLEEIETRTDSLIRLAGPLSQGGAICVVFGG
jgi:hypothetical protein